MGAHNQKLRTFCGFGQSAHWTIPGDKLLDLYVWVLLARLLEVFSQQLALLLLDISPLRLGGRKTSQGSLYLHIHPGVNRNQSGATSLRLTECISSGLLRDLRAIHTDHNRTVLGGFRNVIIFANDNTGQEAWETTEAETEPITMPDKPPMPREPMTIMVTSCDISSSISIGEPSATV